MIPVSKIMPENLYSQDDGQFLLGQGFSVKAAREVILEACRSGQLSATSWKKRYWFSGKDFFEWVMRWYGSQVGQIIESPRGDSLVQSAP